MSGLRVPPLRLEKTIQEVCHLLEKRNHRISHWQSICEDDLWRELVACILGSRVRFHVAHAAVERMDMANLFAEERRCSSYEKYEHDVMSALKGTTNCREDLRLQARYPFAELRAQQIRAAAQMIYARSGTLAQLLTAAGNVREARCRLASDVSGLGPKQASLFLRNIGYAANIAVLDVHVLTYMSWMGLTPARTRSVRTVRQYEALEDTFIEHACSVGCPADCFDVAVWIVVRVAKKEYAVWR